MRLAFVVLFLLVVSCSRPAVLVIQNGTDRRIDVSYDLSLTVLRPGEGVSIVRGSGMKAMIGATDGRRSWGPSLFVVAQGSSVVWKITDDGGVK